MTCYTVHCIGLKLRYSSPHNLGKRVIFTRLRGRGQPHRDQKFVRLVVPRSRAAGCTKTMSFTTCLHLYNQKSTGIHHVFSSVKRNTWAKRRYLQGLLDVLEHTDICSVLSNKLSKHITVGKCCVFLPFKSLPVLKAEKQQTTQVSAVPSTHWSTAQPLELTLTPSPRPFGGILSVGVHFKKHHPGAPTWNHCKRKSLFLTRHSP